jgi:4-hydroxybenzoate polyprenyltransferase
LFVVIGILNSFSIIYYFFLLISALCIIYQHLLAKNRIPYQCISAFENNNIFGLIISFGLILNYL